MSIISYFSSILSAVSTVGSTCGSIDFLCSTSSKSVISITSSKGSSIFGSNIVFSFINRLACSFSISLSLRFPKVACFNRMDNLAVRSLTLSNIKFLAPLKVLSERL